MLSLAHVIALAERTYPNDLMRVVKSCTEDCYFVFDSPGQVELMTLHDSFQTLVRTITDKWSYRQESMGYPHAHTILEGYCQFADARYFLRSLRCSR